jgi:hypothetical protein
LRRSNLGAVEWIRTTTVLLPPAPQAGASASSATTAQDEFEKRLSARFIPTSISAPLLFVCTGLAAQARGRPRSGRLASCLVRVCTAVRMAESSAAVAPKPAMKLRISSRKTARLKPPPRRCKARGIWRAGRRRADARPSENSSSNFSSTGNPACTASR